VDPKKVNFGMARYGRGYTIKDKNCHNIGCEFAKGNVGGKCTDVESSLSNEEIRRLINEKGLVPEFDQKHGVKVLKWDDQLVAYDDYETFELKKDYANDRCFGGVFIWTIDFTGSGSGSRPNIDRDPTGENLEGQHFDSDVSGFLWHAYMPQTRDVRTDILTRCSSIQIFGTSPIPGSSVSPLAQCCYQHLSSRRQRQSPGRLLRLRFYPLEAVRRELG